MAKRKEPEAMDSEVIDLCTSSEDEDVKPIVKVGLYIGVQRQP
jgi:hypothetical protein